MTKCAQQRTALITGANRGLGLATAGALAQRGLNVLLGARDPKLGRRAAIDLAAQGLTVHPVTIDVTEVQSINRCLVDIERAGITIDVLVNNAGVYPPGDALKSAEAAFRETMEVHFFGPLRLCRALIPGMQKRRYGRIVNVSSGSGSFGEGLEGPAAYCISKAAMNALTVKLSQVAGRHVKVNTLCPGWVRTRMGGRMATRGVKKGAETIVWLATLPDDGPMGGYFRDKKPIPW